jgi:hypothetical protein
MAEGKKYFCTGAGARGRAEHLQVKLKENLKNNEKAPYPEI